MTIEKKQCAIYIATCDKYSDLWPGFFHCFHKYWPDCPYDVYLGANQISWPDRRVCTLSSSVDSSWSARIKEHLQNLDYQYVIFILEDFFIRKDISSSAIQKLIDFMVIKDATMLRLLPRPPPQRILDVTLGVGVCDEALPYRICTQASIWRRSSLVQLLRGNENIWEFEHSVQDRIPPNMEGFYCTKYAAIPYRGILFHHVVEKGCWIPSEYMRLRIIGIPYYGNRKMMGNRDYVWLVFAESINRILSIIFQGEAYRIRKKIITMIPGIIIKGYRERRGYK